MFDRRAAMARGAIATAAIAAPVLAGAAPRLIATEEGFAIPETVAATRDWLARRSRSVA